MDKKTLKNSRIVSGRNAIPENSIRQIGPKLADLPGLKNLLYDPIRDRGRAKTLMYDPNTDRGTYVPVDDTEREKHSTVVLDEYSDDDYFLQRSRHSSQSGNIYDFDGPNGSANYYFTPPSDNDDDQYHLTVMAGKGALLKPTDMTMRYEDWYNLIRKLYDGHDKISKRNTIF